MWGGWGPGDTQNWQMFHPLFSSPCSPFENRLLIFWQPFKTSFGSITFSFPCILKTRLLWTVMRRQRCQFDHGKVKRSKRDLRFLCALIRSQPWSPVRSGSLLSLRPDYICGKQYCFGKSYENSQSALTFRVDVDTLVQRAHLGLQKVGIKH